MNPLPKSTLGRPARPSDCASGNGRAFLPAYILVMALGAGCVSVQPGQSRLFHPATPAQMSKEELQDALADFDDLFTATVKQAAEDINGRSQAAAVRKNTLLWQVRMIPACHTALEEADALKSYADMWTLCVRMSRFLQEGEGKNVFGDGQEVAVRVAAQMESEIETLGKRFMTAEMFAKIHDSVQVFAKSHPIRTGFANAIVRTAVAKEEGQDPLAGLLSIPLAPFRAMEGVDRGAQAIRGFTVVADRFTDIVDQMPEAARWQTELLLYDLEDNAILKRFLATFEQFSASAASFSTTAERLPERLRQEGSELVKEIDARQANLQETLNRAEKVAVTVEKALERVDVVAASIDQTARSVTETGSVWQAAAATIGQTVKDISGDEVRGSRPASTQPFDINDYRKTADAMTQTALELEKLAIEIQRLVDSPQLSQRIQDVDNRAQAAVNQTAMRARDVADHIVWRAGELAAFVFGLALVYRVVAGRVLERHTKTI